MPPTRSRRGSTAKRLRELANGGVQLPRVRFGVRRNATAITPDADQQDPNALHSMALQPSTSSITEQPILMEQSPPSTSEPHIPVEAPPPPFGSVYSGENQGGETEPSIVNLTNIQPSTSEQIVQDSTEETRDPVSTTSSHQLLPPITRPEDTIASNRGREIWDSVDGKEKIIKFATMREHSPDVELRVAEKVYHLHSFILRYKSKWFDTSLSSIWGRPVSGRRDGIKYVYVLEMDKTGCMILKPIETQSQIAQVMSADTHLDVGSLLEAREAYDTYDTLFRCLCDNQNYRKGLLSIRQCENLLTLADIYDCQSSISTMIEAAIWNWPDPHRQIAITPLRFMLLSLRIRLAKLFRFSFVHLVGRWDVPIGEGTPFDSHLDLELPELNSLSIQICRSCKWSKIYKHVLTQKRSTQPIYTLLCERAQQLAARQSKVISSLIAFNFGTQKHKVASRIVQDRIRTAFQNPLFGSVPGQERRLFEAIHNDPYEPTPDEENEHNSRWAKGDKPVNLKAAMQSSVDVVRRKIKYFLANHSGLAENSELLKAASGRGLGYLLCGDYEDVKMPWEGEGES